MKIKVGTDCSGIEAPIQALKKLKINFDHIFSSEVNKYCIESIKANYDPEIIFGDITLRNLKDVPYVDLYVCGFPCQPFSATGKLKGFKDSRSNIFYYNIDLIKAKKPKIFILENVKGLMHYEKGKWWSIIQKELKTLDKLYDITFDIYNTREYGIPQNRERLFIIGIKRTESAKKFEKPVKKPLKNILNFIDRTDTSKNSITKSVSHMIKRTPAKAVFVDYGQISNTSPNSDKWSPAITTTNTLWCVKMKRRSNVKERLMLQGFPKNFKVVVSNTQMNKQIGNSMSVNVLKYIIKEALSCLKK